jgi:hypothetical protein
MTKSIKHQKCRICNGTIDNLSAIPNKWSLEIPCENGNGEFRTYCYKCVAKAVELYKRQYIKDNG